MQAYADAMAKEGEALRTATQEAQVCAVADSCGAVGWRDMLYCVCVGRG